MSEVRYMISEAAKKVQVESHVLRYWEEELALEIGRTDMGHRYYTEDDIQLFLCIQKLKNEGMLLRDLKPMIPELTATRKRLNAARSEKKTQSAAESIARADTMADKSDVVSGKTAIGKSYAASDQSNVVSDKAGTISGSNGSVPDTRAQTSTQNPLTAPPAADTTVSTKVTAPETEVVQMTQLEQVRSLIGDVLTDVVSANNETLKKDISRKVTADVIREMDFLFQANERREEEHYRKLDMLIRQQQAHRREAIRETPIGKLKKLLT